MQNDLLLESYLKRLRLPAIRAQYKSLAREAAEARHGYEDYLFALAEQEILNRDQKMQQLRIKRAAFPYLRTLDGFDFTAVPSLNKEKVLQLARGEFIERGEAIIFMGPSGVGKTHLMIALGVACCQLGKSVRFFTAAGLINEMVEAQAGLRLSKLERQLARTTLVCLDEIGYIPFSTTGAQLLFQFFAERYERGSVVVTTNLEFGQWTEVFGQERLTAALLDRLTHRCHIFELHGESYRFRQSLRARGGGPEQDSGKNGKKGGKQQ
jgi:DNA replication protein DnaC